MFSVDEARALMPDVHQRVAQIVTLRADLAELTAAIRTGAPSPHGGVAEAKGLEARLHEALGWLRDQGLQVKGFAPVLLDFPAVLDGDDVLLCWLEGEPALGWYHRRELGFAGRRPLD